MAHKEEEDGFFFFLFATCEVCGQVFAAPSEEDVQSFTEEHRTICLYIN